MKRYIYILLASAFLASCSDRIEQPNPGVALGEIYLTAPAGSKTVAVDLDGIWRVSALEDWISLDVNGREGHGAFTFSYSSNESDFAHVNPTRLGHIIIQSLNTMNADTLYVRQQGTPDGVDYVSYLNNNYIEFVETYLTDLTLVYADFDGVDDASAISDWISDVDADVVAAVCPVAIAESLVELYPGQIVSHEGLVVISTVQSPEKESISTSPSSLTVKVGYITYVVADFGEHLQETSRYIQMRNLLENGYNAPMAKGKWFIGGTFWYLSAMGAGYPSTPSWYPQDPSSSDFDADLYAWENNLLDCIWMVRRDYVSTYTDEEVSMSWRPSYVYASAEAWNTVSSLEVLDEPVTGMKHKPFIITLKY